MSKYLVTGGEGFIGGNILSKIEGEAYDIKSGFDILNKETFLEKAKNFDGIFHCAAKISVPESFLFPEEYFKNNVDGTKCVATIANEFSQKIVFSSSAAVYGESDTAVAENFNLNPKSPYAENKLAGENILKDSGGRHIILRYFNVYGPGQSSEYAGVITFFILNALSNKDLIIFGNGEQVRDFIFVEDVTRANILAMNYENKEFEIFNISSGIKTSIKELAEMIIKLTKSSSKIVFKDARKGDIFFSQGSSKKAKDVLGWEASISLEEGLSKTIAYYKSKI
ncbi:MAG: NAD-dependent epimerase/dehydratase family protein [Candidatus Pacebacteria bacterium]|nr:NAD-dependent epimerase/dehydratase family protein [Candidatus Paceibacterota bacterium]